MSFQVCSPRRATQTTLKLPSATMYGNAHKVFTPRDAQLSLGIWGFYRGSVVKTWLTGCVAGLSLQPLQKSNPYYVAQGYHRKSCCALVSMLVP